MANLIRGVKCLRHKPRDSHYDSLRLYNDLGLFFVAPLKTRRRWQKNVLKKSKIPEYFDCDRVLFFSPLVETKKSQFLVHRECADSYSFG